VRVLAPTVNSYKRLIRRGAMSYYSWAPVFNSVRHQQPLQLDPRADGRRALRVPQRRLVAESVSAATLCLAAGLEGIRNGPDPGEPHAENLYECSDAQLAAIGVEPLPRTLGEAVEAFAADPFVERVLGTELRDEFIRYKRAEWEGVPPARERLGDQTLRTSLLTARGSRPWAEGGRNTHETLSIESHIRTGNYSQPRRVAPRTLKWLQQTGRVSRLGDRQGESLFKKHDVRCHLVMVFRSTPTRSRH
jgi:hypothetical protein